MWTFLCIAILICLFICYTLVGKRKHGKINSVPGPKGKFLVGNAFDFLMTPESFFSYFQYLANKYKDMFEITLGINSRFLVVHHPLHAEALISGSLHNDKGYLYQFLRPWLRDGLLLSSGKKWHQRRKILTPAFHFKVLNNFHSILLEKSAKLVDDLESEVDSPRTNIFSIIADFTLNSICETAMGTDLDQESSTDGNSYKNAIHDLGTYIFQRCIRIWLHSDTVFNMTPISRAQNRTLNCIRSFRDGIINQRRRSGISKDLYTKAMNENDDDFLVKSPKRLAMLDLLLNAEQDGVIDSEGINEEVDTFMFEGHDTTASALQFAFMLLANHPHDQDKIVEEYSQLFGTSNQRPSMSDLSKMKYLEACIKESLRLYPPVHFIQRQSNNPLKLGHMERPAPTQFTILILNLHRRADQFIEPLEFHPERFLKEPTWHPFSYLPFSAGQRNCIGQKFAMMEMMLAISAVLSKYRLLPITKPQDILFAVDMILRPKDPIYVKFEKR